MADIVPPAPTPPAFIVDVAGVLKPAERELLNERLLGIQRDLLGTVAVAILPAIGEFRAAEVGAQVYRSWKVGADTARARGRRDVGVLLLIVVNAAANTGRDACSITAGTGAEVLVTEVTAVSICSNAVLPQMQARNLVAAISGGIGSIEYRLRGATRTFSQLPPADGRQIRPPSVEAQAPSAPPARQPAQGVPPPTQSRRSAGTVRYLAGAAAVLFVSVLAFRRWRRNRPRKCAKCGRLMQRLNEMSDDAQLTEQQRLQELNKETDYDVWVCRCGEKVVVGN